MNWFMNPEEKRLRAGWRLLLQFFMMLFFIAGSYFIISLVAPEISFLLNSLASMVAFTLSVWIAVRYLDRRSFRSLGIGFNSRWFRDVGAGFGMAAVAMSVIFMIEFATGWIRFTGFGWSRAWMIPYPLPLVGYLAGMLMVGFYEELVFRGYQITNLTEGFAGNYVSSRQAVALAILISSGIFGILHAGNPNASLISSLNIMIAGIVLAVPYLLTGSLALSTGLHAGWNFFQGGIFGFPVSGSPTRSSLLQIRETGPDLLTGGRFGPEAGFMGIVGLLIILLMCYQYIRKSSCRLDLHDSFKKRESL